MLAPIMVLWVYIKNHVRQLREDEHGYTTETVLVTAALVALALVVIAILIKVVTDKANSIQM
jgi:hypothetical protein